VAISKEEARLAQGIFDVVVVGSGAAGLSAAVVAAREGASVVVLECAETCGGTTAKSSGGFWIPGNRVMRDRGFQENRENCIAHMALLAYPEDFDFAAERHGLSQDGWDLLVSYFANAVRAVEDLESTNDLSYMIMESFRGDDDGLPPWYFTEYDGTYGRLLAPKPLDEAAARVNGSAFAIFAARGVSAQASNETATMIRARGAAHGDGTDLVGQLLSSAKKYGVTVVVEHRVADVITDEAGAVVGVLADTPRGRAAVAARQGVVFANGGMEHNEYLRRRFLRGPIVGTCGVSTNRGDFVAIAERLGAGLANTSEAWWAELPLEPCLESFEQGDLITQIYGDSSILVDAHGERVVNEKILYNERAKVHFVQDATGGYPNYLLFNIFDDAVVQDDTAWPGRWPIPYANDVPSYTLQADTLQELSQALGQRLEELSEHTGGFALKDGFAERLEQTIGRFNRFARQGRDEDFGRGEKETERYFSADTRTRPMPNPTMFPFADSGPYYAVILGASCLGTKGGPRINAKSQVVRPDGSPIPGLYGAGNCIGSPAGAAYWGGGSTLGPALTHGYLAGRNVVTEPLREPATDSGRLTSVMGDQAPIAGQ
jgi:predicted oxidoreductase